MQNIERILNRVRSGKECAPYKIKVSFEEIYCSRYFMFSDFGGCFAQEPETERGRQGCFQRNRGTHCP